MKDYRLIYFILASLVAAVLLWYTSPMVWKRSPATGRRVYVNDAHGNAKVADFLEQLRLDVSTLLERGLSDYPNDLVLLRIKDRWTGDVSEVERGSANIAYSISKSDVRVCVRDSSGALGDKNAAMYVLLHELAHVATNEFGHTETFWKNMRYLLELAEKYGIYTFTDHVKQSTTLCDRPLGESPLTCVKSGSCSSELRDNNFLG